MAELNMKTSDRVNLLSHLMWEVEWGMFQSMNNMLLNSSKSYHLTNVKLKFTFGGEDAIFVHWPVEELNIELFGDVVNSWNLV